MLTVIIMIVMFMSFVPTTMAEAEEVLEMFEEVMTVITSTEVASKVFIIQSNNQSSKDIFMKENEDEIVEEEVSCFDSLLFLSNKPSPMTTRPLWWWFTKDVLRRTTATQLDEEGAEEAEAERRNTNRGIKVRVKGSLVEEGGWEEPTQEKLYPKTRAHVHTFRFFFMCPVASEGSNSLVAVSLEGR